MTKHSQTGKWRAYTTVDGKQVSFGLHKTEKLAREAYLANITKYREFIRL